jgi:hypothetical protein
LKKLIENISSLIEAWCKKKLVFASPLLPFGQSLGKPTHIAQIYKSTKLAHKPKLQKSGINPAPSNLQK